MTTFAASEGIQFGLPAGRILQTDNLPSWWDQAKRKEIEAFKSQCYDLSMDLMSSFAAELGVDEDFFCKSHLHSEPGNNLKFIKYPRMEEQADGIPRLSEHTDWGSLTFVFSTQGGLEIRDPKDEWCHVPVVPGGIVVNIGDALSLWTGKALKSTLHRITWENLSMDNDRYSIAYFVNPNYGTLYCNLSISNDPSSLSSDAPLRTPGAKQDETQPSLTYQDFYKIRLRLTYGGIQDLKSGKSTFEDINPDLLEVVRKLGVANHGLLESNHLIKT
jgi:isopenicillin N synthase-like dioxygenase